MTEFQVLQEKQLAQVCYSFSYINNVKVVDYWNAQFCTNYWSRFNAGSSKDPLLEEFCLGSWYCLWTIFFTALISYVLITIKLSNKHFHVSSSNYPESQRRSQFCQSFEQFIDKLFTYLFSFSRKWLSYNWDFKCI